MRIRGDQSGRVGGSARVCFRCWRHLWCVTVILLSEVRRGASYRMLSM